MAAHAERAAGAAAEEQLRAILERARRLESSQRGLSATESLQPPPLVLYGAGPLARMTLAHLRRIGVAPLAVADGNEARWGAEFEGYRILPPAEAVRRFAVSARFAVTIYNGSAIRNQLMRMGCTRVMHFADLYFEHAAEFLPYCGLAARGVVLDAAQAVLGAASVWHDERSVREYLAQIEWRLRLTGAQPPRHDPPAECYFPAGIYRYLADEVLFDCGAFDGDSIRQFLARRAETGDPRIVAFEPDAGSFARLGDFVGSLPKERSQRIRIEPYALAERDGDVPFAALGSVQSGIDETGDNKVRAIALDSLDAAPTLIKMDVEGFELAALKGAARTIARHMPVLAISLYHHAADLWTIPSYLKAMTPDYRLFLRRYAEDCWEQVLYAVPAARLAGVGAARA